MTGRLRLLPLLVATTATLLVAALGATITAEQAHALKCKPACIPPPEEGFEEEAPPPPPPSPPTPPPKTALVISVGWSTGGRGSSELVPGENQGYVDYMNNHMNEWFAQSASPASFQPWKVSSGGSYMIEPPVIPPGQPPQFGDDSPRNCTEEEQHRFFEEVFSRAEGRARQNGINPDSYTVVVVEWLSPICYGGRREGRRIGLTNRTHAMHEFGHYHGLGHANLLRCKDEFGNRVPLSTNCIEKEYWDPYDAMGSVTRLTNEMSYNAMHTNQLGWLTGQFFDLTAGASTRTLTIKPFTAPAHTERAIRLRDGATTLWIEYRTELGIDGSEFTGHIFPPEPGVVIHRDMPGGVSQLLDMTPGSVLREANGVLNEDGDVFDAPLPAGQTWGNPLGEMQVTVNSAGSEGVSVTLATRRVTMPDVRGMEVERAYAILRNLGFDPAPWNPVIDQTCSHIGAIAEQEPFPGTRWLPEQPVRLGVGEHPPFGCP
jgi:PASTA domain